MLGSIAVKKEIYTCETAQIGIGLHIGEVKSLCESSNTSYYIFYSVKYLFLVHDFALLAYNNLLMLNTKLEINFEISIGISIKYVVIFG